MRLVVTGATGFVGRALCPVLREHGHSVRPLGRADTGDLSGALDWRPLVEGADAVIHLAALAHDRGSDRRSIVAVNVRATEALSKAAARAGAKFLFLSTVKVLGEETGSAPFDDRSPVAPGDTYAEAKAAAEACIRDTPGLRWTILRPPLIYGPGVKANFHSLLSAVAKGWPLPLGSIANARSLLFMGNLADAALRCLATPAAEGKTYLVADGEAISTPALCRAMGAALGRPALLFPFPPGCLAALPRARRLCASLVIDDGRIRRELGWSPRFRLAEGLDHTARWLLAGRPR